MSAVAFVEQFEAAGFVHTRCPTPPESALERRSSAMPQPGATITTFVHRESSQLYALCTYGDHEQWYAMTPTRETLAKIVAVGSGAEAAKL